MRGFHLTQREAADAGQPMRETRLEPGELITGYRLPASVADGQAYVKVRERASYEYAIVSAAAAVRLDRGVIATARVALGSVVNLLSPQTIVLGGYFAPLSEWLTPPIERELQARVLGGPPAVPPILPSSLGPEAAMRGAAATQLRRVLVDPTLVSA